MQTDPCKVKLEALSSMEKHSEFSYNVLLGTRPIHSSPPPNISLRSSSLYYYHIFLLLSPIFKIWKENHPLKTVKPGVFFELTCRLIMSDFGFVLTVKRFLDQIIANLPQNANETIRFLKTSKFGFF